MASSAPELKPCPFCGGMNIKTFANSVVCNSPDCGASGPDLGHVYDMPAAIEAWNTRASAHPVTVEMLAAILWREQVVDVGAPGSVIAGRTPQAFCNESDQSRAPFLKYASAAIAAMKEMK